LHSVTTQSTQYFLSTQPDAERSIYTESEYTESQYSESQAQSSRFTYDDSYADEEEDEAYLFQQALASARAVHHIHGVEYDENQEIDVMTDVKFHVANIKLPLGLLFQEHEIGAWVSRVVPDGNGARKGVQHGDQLASINGKSAVHASIDEVAATISRTPKNTSVELTFLRYIGPLKPVPGAIIQEGFEVTDSSVNKKAPPRPPKTKPMSPAKSKSRFFTKNPPSSPKASSSGNIGSPARSPKAVSSPTSPSRKMEDTANVDADEGGSNSRSIQKKKIKALGKMMSFKKKK
jgi:C-terminal processing protease CtpA/Prc